MITSIQTVKFWRTQDDHNNQNTEEGLLFNEGEFHLIDSNGEKVDNVWTYSTTLEIALFNLKIGNPHKAYELTMCAVGDKFKLEQNSFDIFMVIDRPESMYSENVYSIKCLQLNGGNQIGERKFSSDTNVYYI